MRAAETNAGSTGGKQWYFADCEDRMPPPPIPYSLSRELLYQYLATITLVTGAWYLAWRWTSSINFDALWFALPLVIAETLAFVGLALFVFNLWRTADPPVRPPPRVIGECVRDSVEPDRPLAVDLFIATYNEDPELVRLSIRDAKRITYPHPIDLIISVIDDGRRPAMRQVAAEEEVSYVTRDTNLGFKAGNLRNAMEETGGDFIVICDADTRAFPDLLENTLGYFRDPDVAWVQTPQWFYDIPAGRALPVVLGRRLGRFGEWLGQAVEACIGGVTIGRDPFVADPQMFFDIILRRRNWANASFCCGAGSVHRREAIMQAALRQYAGQIGKIVHSATRMIRDHEIRADLTAAMTREVARETELTPYKFHVSEDIYTSIILHSDQARRWKSILHSQVESKMLSPQDLHSFMVQRFKYAGGTLDIALHDNPLFRRGMTWAQRLMYAGTFWAYFGALWNVVFILAPVVFLFTGIAPVAAYSTSFFKHALPFLFCNELAMMVGTWGVAGWDGKASYLYFFPLHLRALWTVVRGKRIAFPATPKEREEGNFFHLVIPQAAAIALTAAALVFAGWQLVTGVSHNVVGFVVNAFWGLHNIAALSGIVRAAFWQPEA